MQPRRRPSLQWSSSQSQHCSALSSPPSHCYGDAESALRLLRSARHQCSLLTRVTLVFYFTWRYSTDFFVDSSPVRVRHVSAHADDADPDGSNTISQSVAMAIAGSPLPHAKANQFVLPTVVSGGGVGQAVPLGPTDWQVTDQALCGGPLPPFDRPALFCNPIQTLIQTASTFLQCSFSLMYNCMS